jgi:hypothetical protein
MVSALVLIPRREVTPFVLDVVFVPILRCVPAIRQSVIHVEKGHPFLRVEDRVNKPVYERCAPGARDQDEATLFQVMDRCLPHPPKVANVRSRVPGKRLPMCSEGSCFKVLFPHHGPLAFGRRPVSEAGPSPSASSAQLLVRRPATRTRLANHSTGRRPDPLHLPERADVTTRRPGAAVGWVHATTVQLAAQHGCARTKNCTTIPGDRTGERRQS